MRDQGLGHRVDRHAGEAHREAPPSRRAWRHGRARGSVAVPLRGLARRWVRERDDADAGDLLTEVGRASCDGGARVVDRPVACLAVGYDPRTLQRAAAWVVAGVATSELGQKNPPT